jgi:hypothetical protein
VLERFSAERMADDYERIYARRLQRAGREDLVPIAVNGGSPSVSVSPAGDDGHGPRPTPVGPGGARTGAD